MYSVIKSSLSNSCESLGKITVKEGTETTDAECKNGAHSYVLPLILSVIAVCVLVFAIFIILKKKKQSSGQEQKKETRQAEIQELQLTLS